MAYTPPVQVIGTGFKVSSVFATTSDITLYVRTTGSDSNDGLTSGTALLTVQEAISRIPLSIGHAVVIDIGEGTFNGFTLSARSYTSAAASLLIKGVTDLATGLASGTNSGTATGGTTTTLIDSGQSWTANDLRGRMALVDGEYRVIYSNDATSITFVGPFTLTCNGKAYQIVEQKTILNTLGYTNSVVLLTGQVSFSINPCIAIQDIKITTPVGTSYRGIKMESTGSFSLTRLAVISQAGQIGIRAHTILGSIIVNDVYITGGANGFYGAQCGNMPTGVPYGLYRVFCYSMTSYGVIIYYSTQIMATYVFIDTCVNGATTQSCEYVKYAGVYIKNCSTAGITGWNDHLLYVSTESIIETCGIGLRVQGVGAASVDTSTIIQNNTSHGILVNDSTRWYPLSSITVTASKIINNGGSGIFVRGPGVVNISSLSTVGGTGNTRFGIELEDGSQAYVKSGIIANPLTGAMGDATVDDVKTVLTWSTDFAANLASVTDDTVGTSIKRRD